MANSITKKAISADGAQRVIAAAAAKAIEIGSPSTIAVVDDSGELKALLRMDGASLLSVKVATEKAYTATAGGVATADLFGFIRDDESLLSTLPTVPGVNLIGGGVPVMIDGVPSGAVGVSGGHYSQDVEIAEAGLGALGDG